MQVQASSNYGKAAANILGLKISKRKLLEFAELVQRRSRS
jgi:hypothetical protein